MTGEEWLLQVTVFFSRLASGFLGVLCTIMRPMLIEMAALTDVDNVVLGWCSRVSPTDGRRWQQRGPKLAGKPGQTLVSVESRG